MSPDPFARAQAESDNQRIAFIGGELAMCFTFTVLATMNYEAGNRDSAEQSMVVAEGAYAAVLPLVSNPKCSKHLNDEAMREFSAELERLRERLDGLTTKLNKNIDSPAEMKRSQ